MFVAFKWKCIKHPEFNDLIKQDDSYRQQKVFGIAHIIRVKV
jgi:hypothetical protein